MLIAHGQIAVKLHTHKICLSVNICKDNLITCKFSHTVISVSVLIL